MDIGKLDFIGSIDGPMPRYYQFFNNDAIMYFMLFIAFKYYAGTPIVFSQKKKHNDIPVQNVMPYVDRTKKRGPEQRHHTESPSWQRAAELVA